MCTAQILLCSVNSNSSTNFPPSFPAPFSSVQVAPPNPQTLCLEQIRHVVGLFRLVSLLHPATRRYPRRAVAHLKCLVDIVVAPPDPHNLCLEQVRHVVGLSRLVFIVAPRYPLSVTARSQASPQVFSLRSTPLDPHLSTSPFWCVVSY